MTAVCTWDVFSTRLKEESDVPAHFDLELLASRTLDGHTQELVYRPTLR